MSGLKNLNPLQKTVLGLGFLLLLGLGIGLGVWMQSQTRTDFAGDRAYQYVLKQVAFGPRVVNSPAHQECVAYIAQQLQAEGWQVEFQDFTYHDTPIRNIIAKTNVGRGPIIIIGAHYDSRLQADRDATNPTAPVPGANDGASGVAVLLELAHSLDRGRVPYEVWLAFFDAEDNGDIAGWEWLVGSTYMATHLPTKPAQMLLVDMIGDADQQIYLEGYSNPTLAAAVWAVAADLGYGAQFIPERKHTVVDDHYPFLLQQIPAIDIIDFDYPHWHTTTDTADKVSAASLERVGRTLETYLEEADKWMPQLP